MILILLQRFGILIPPCNLLLNRYRLEDIKPIQRGGDNSARNLRMPVQLLDVLLTLMYEHHLRGNFTAIRWRLVHST